MPAAVQLVLGDVLHSMLSGLVLAEEVMAGSVALVAMGRCEALDHGIDEA